MNDVCVVGSSNLDLVVTTTSPSRARRDAARHLLPRVSRRQGTQSGRRRHPRRRSRCIRVSPGGRRSWRPTGRRAGQRRDHRRLRSTPRRHADRSGADHRRRSRGEHHRRHSRRQRRDRPAPLPEARLSSANSRSRSPSLSMPSPWPCPGPPDDSQPGARGGAARRAAGALFDRDPQPARGEQLGGRDRLFALGVVVVITTLGSRASTSRRPRTRRTSSPSPSARSTPPAPATPSVARSPWPSPKARRDDRAPSVPPPVRWRRREGAVPSLPAAPRSTRCSEPITA